MQSLKVLRKQLHVTNPDSRRFEGFASVEMVDKEGEIIPVAEIEKVMNDFMATGGNVTDSHSNRIVGKVLNWMPKEKNGIPGIFVTAEIHNNNPLHDEIWKRIKKEVCDDDECATKDNCDHIYRGFSFGGANMGKSNKVIEGRRVPMLKDLSMFELAVCAVPCNPESLFEEVNMLAKSDIKKPFADYPSFDACVADNKDKDDPKAFCASIQERVENTGKNDVTFKRGLEPNKLLSSSDKEERKIMSKQEIIQKADEEEKPMPPKEEEPKEEEKKKADVSKDMSEIKALLKELVSRMPATPTAKLSEPAKADEDVNPAPDGGDTKLPKEPEDESPDKGVATPAAATSEAESEFTEKVQSEVNKNLEKLGFKKSSTPRPDSGEVAPITKDVKKGISVERMLSAKKKADLPKWNEINEHFEKMYIGE